MRCFVLLVAFACVACEGECPRAPASREDLRATPRPDGRAEWLALLAGGGPVATQAMYERVRVDLEAIDVARPEVARVGIAQSCRFLDSLTLELSKSAFADLQSGDHAGLDALNDWYGNEVVSVDEAEGFRFAWLGVRGRLDTDVVGRDYECLDGVSVFPPITPGFTIPESYACARRDGDRMEYEFGFIACEAGGDCAQTVHHAVTGAAGEIDTLETWRSADEPPPPWLQSASCALSLAWGC